MERIHNIYRPAEERRNDWGEVERVLADDELKEQTSRCMNCGQPFCHTYGCPLGNLVPDQNRAVALGEWRRAYELLSANSDFPEFTSHVCPALCEASCVHQLDEEAVMIRQSEKRIIETAFDKGWVVPRRPEKENGKTAAVIGAGPAGLSAAVTLRRRGWSVTVYEKRDDIGGLLRYGIPSFKLDKALIDRRRRILEEEGLRFVTGIEVGADISAQWLARRFDAVIVAIGTPAARDLDVPGRDLGGVHLALELLEGQNRFLTGEISEPPINAKGKNVLVIGGGDTGSDCVGTSIRHGARKVTQIEIMPEPPRERDASTPWPLWPHMLRTSSSHKEGCERRWNLNSLRFVGKNGKVSGAEVETVEWEFSPEGSPVRFHAVPGTKEIMEADLVFLAMGFTGVGKDNPIVAQLGLSQTPRMTLLPEPSRNIYCVGDCATGASLVVHALASGKDLPLD
ncbi:MAG: glutamate synthase subunit beta [Deltaproteobacteria bacterium]|nr:glutamate synthase subunit beta [Deltaproteobacteria bacterium]